MLLRVATWSKVERNVVKVLLFAVRILLSLTSRPVTQTSLFSIPGQLVCVNTFPKDSLSLSLAFDSLRQALASRRETNSLLSVSLSSTNTQWPRHMHTELAKDPYLDYLCDIVQAFGKLASKSVRGMTVDGGRTL